jgi:haloalkane dehalogenase
VDVLRTPDERFADDEGPRTAAPVLLTHERPFVTAYADREDITRFFEPLFQERVPGARGRQHETIPNAGHFLQEHAPERLVEIILGLSRART